HKLSHHGARGWSCPLRCAWRWATMDTNGPLLILLVLGFTVGCVVGIVCYFNLADRIRLAERDIRRLQDAHAEVLQRPLAGTPPAPAATRIDPPVPARDAATPPTVEEPA